MTAKTDRMCPHARRTFARAATVLAAAGVAVIAIAGPASAHISVDPSSATQGGYGAFTFRVPNEQEKASTTKIELALPTDTPLASVSVKPATEYSLRMSAGFIRLIVADHATKRMAAAARHEMT